MTMIENETMIERVSAHATWAFLGKITPDVRYIFVRIDDAIIEVDVFKEGEISEEDIEHFDDSQTAIIAEFHAHGIVDFKCKRLDYPIIPENYHVFDSTKMDKRWVCIYRRFGEPDPTYTYL